MWFRDASPAAVIITYGDGVGCGISGAALTFLVRTWKTSISVEQTAKYNIIIYLWELLGYCNFFSYAIGDNKSSML